MQGLTAVRRPVNLPSANPAGENPPQSNTASQFAESTTSRGEMLPETPTLLPKQPQCFVLHNVESLAIRL